MEIANLDKDDSCFNSRLCEILGIKYLNEEEFDIKEIESKKLKISKLRQITDDEEIINNIDFVAFEQEDLTDILEKEVSKIYLFEGNYTIPLIKENITYVGINMPVLSFEVPDIIILEEKNIELKNVIVTNNGKIIPEEIRKKVNKINKEEFRNVFMNFRHELILAAEEKKHLGIGGYSIGEIMQKPYAFSNITKYDSGNEYNYFIYFDNVIDDVPKIIIMNCNNYITTIIKFDNDITRNIFHYIIEGENANKYIVKNKDINRDMFAITKKQRIINTDDIDFKKLNGIQQYCSANFVQNFIKDYPKTNKN